MKIIILSICLLVSINSFSQSLTHLDEKNGYGGVLLGDTITKVKSYGSNVVLGQGKAVFEKLGLKTYFIQDSGALKANDNLKFDNFTITYINDKVYEIDLYFGASSSADVYEILTKAYGTSFNQPDKKFLIWIGKNVTLTWFNKGESEQHISFVLKSMQANYNKLYDTYIKSQSSKF